MTLLRKYYEYGGFEGGGIPDEVKQKLNKVGDAEVTNLFNNGITVNKAILRGLERCAHEGYSLASEMLAQKDKIILESGAEIERLKEENERLRGENNKLKTDIDNMGRHLPYRI